MSRTESVSRNSNMGVLSLKIQVVQTFDLTGGADHHLSVQRLTGITELALKLCFCSIMTLSGMLLNLLDIHK